MLHFPTACFFHEPMNFPIDREHFAQVTDGDHEFAVELLQAYLGDTQVRLDLIAEAIPAHDRELVRRSAHHLRGSSSNLGIGGISQLAKDMELNDCSWEEIQTMLGQMQVIFRQVQSYAETLSATGG